MKKSFLFHVILSFFVFSACSLKYNEVVQAETKIPEFTFTNVDLTRYEDNRVTVEFSAENLEQYKNSSDSYAKGIEFKAYDKYSELTTSGKCGYLAADTDNEVYTMYDDIEVYSKTDETRFYSDALKWDSKTEQLTSGRSANVRIEKDDTVMYGSGFSASGVSKTFRFSGSVNGEINTKEEEEGNGQQSEISE